MSAGSGRIQVTAAGIALSGGKLTNTIGAGTDFPAAGTIIKTDFWNSAEIEGADCTLSTVTNDITINKTGKWRVHSRFYISGGGDTDWSWTCFVYVNEGEAFRRVGFQTGSSANLTGASMGIDTMLVLASGDVVDIRGSVSNSADPVSPGGGSQDDLFEVIFLGT